MKNMAFLVISFSFCTSVGAGWGSHEEASLHHNGTTITFKRLSVGDLAPYSLHHEHPLDVIKELHAMARHHATMEGEKAGTVANRPSGPVSPWVRGQGPMTLSPVRSQQILEVIKRESPQGTGEHLTGLMAGLSAASYKAFQESPLVVAGAGIAGGCVGAWAGWGLSQAATPALAAKAMAAGKLMGLTPDPTGTAQIVSVGIMATATVVGLLGSSSAAAWGLLNEDEFKHAYTKGFNQGVRGCRFVKEEIIKSLKDFNQTKNEDKFQKVLDFYNEDKFQKALDFYNEYKF